VVCSGERRSTPDVGPRAETVRQGRGDGIVRLHTECVNAGRILTGVDTRLSRSSSFMRARSSLDSPAPATYVSLRPRQCALDRIRTRAYGSGGPTAAGRSAW